MASSGHSEGIPDLVRPVTASACTPRVSLLFSGLTDFAAASCIIQYKAVLNEIDSKDLFKGKPRQKNKD